MQDAQLAAQQENDATFKQQAEDELRGVWEGPAYRQNLAAVNNMLAGWPEGLADAVLTARTADGKPLGNVPGFIQQLASLSLELNPAASLVPAGGGDPAKGLSDEIASIEKTMRETPDTYWKDTKMQDRYRDLLEAQEKVSKRAG